MTDRYERIRAALTDTGELLACLETRLKDKNDEYHSWGIDMTC
jgi:hypothetical protein